MFKECFHLRELLTIFMTIYNLLLVMSVFLASSVVGGQIPITN